MFVCNNQPHFPRLPNRAIGPDSFQFDFNTAGGTRTHTSLGQEIFLLLYVTIATASVL